MRCNFKSPVEQRAEIASICRQLRAELGAGEGVTALLENSERALQISGQPVVQASHTP